MCALQLCRFVFVYVYIYIYLYIFDFWQTESRASLADQDSISAIIESIQISTMKKKAQKFTPVKERNILENVFLKNQHERDHHLSRTNPAELCLVTVIST